MQYVIVGWQIYDLTKDEFALGLIGLAEAIPALSISLYGGYLADHQKRKPIIVITMLVMVLGAISLTTFSYLGPTFFSTYGVFPIYAVIFMHGFARGFMSPAVMAFLNEIVPREIYANSTAWNSTVWQTGAVTGPAIGGILYGVIGVTNSYITVVILMVLAVLSISMIHSRPKPVHEKKEAIKNSLKEGLRFVFGEKIILSAISLDLFAVLFGGAVALLPAFADKVLHVGPSGLGALRAAPSVGAVVTGLMVAHRPMRHNTGKYLLVCVAGFGLCMIAFALSESFILSMAILAVSGALDAVSVIIRSTTLQLLTPNNMRGRVSAVNMMFVGSSNEIGAFESGLAAKFLGLTTSVVFGGIMTLVSVTTIGALSPKLRRLELKNIM